MLEANRLTNTQVSKTVTDRIRITCVNSPENNYQVFIVHVAFPICCFCHSNDFFKQLCYADHLARYNIYM